eukprot:TRINITY_DN77723_c0_g1_i1.p1 TRINITY_DN77723_c0_g1~~TRINITY_DN77723_c0_g1_i1.p1  ORF type:complete len:142 (-),score=10.23 TRINITY_DN77723_c0_g1_i1:38-442(-)
MDPPCAPALDAKSSGNVSEKRPMQTPHPPKTRSRDAGWTFVRKPQMSTFPRRLRQLCLGAASATDVSAISEEARETDKLQPFDSMMPCQVEPSSSILRPEPAKRTSVGAMIRNAFRRRSSKGHEANAHAARSVP